MSPNMLSEIAKKTFDSGGAPQAISFLKNSGDAKAAMSAFIDLMLEAYWKKKDIPATVQLGQAGIEFCLGRAEALSSAEQTAERAHALKSAKALAFNLASFCWPG